MVNAPPHRYEPCRTYANISRTGVHRTGTALFFSYERKK
nr:MAG TPA: hypothetical protein [Bacteriophage sp.]